MSVTILAYVKRDQFELIVCGAPDAAWIEWVRTTDMPLTQDQMSWREVANERVRRLAHIGHHCVVERPQACLHLDSCDRCGMCEVCACECHEAGS